MSSRYTHGSTCGCASEAPARGLNANYANSRYWVQSHARGGHSHRNREGATLHRTNPFRNEGSQLVDSRSLQATVSDARDEDDKADANSVSSDGTHTPGNPASEVEGLDQWTDVKKDGPDAKKTEGSTPAASQSSLWQAEPTKASYESNVQALKRANEELETLRSDNEDLKATNTKLSETVHALLTMYQSSCQEASQARQEAEEAQRKVHQLQTELDSNAAELEAFRSKARSDRAKKEATEAEERETSFQEYMKALAAGEKTLGDEATAKDFEEVFQALSMRQSSVQEQPSCYADPACQSVTIVIRPEDLADWMSMVGNDRDDDGSFGRGFRY